MSLILIVLIAIFLAALVKSLLGFGDALIAMPLLTLAIGIQIATPLVGLFGISMSFFMLLHHRQHLDMGAVWRLILSAAVGVPLGLLMFHLIPAQLVNLILGVVLILYSLYTLFQPRWIKLDDVRWAYLFGFASGVLGSAYNASGPPMVIYGSSRQWSPDQFRGTLQSFFLPTSLMIIIGQGLSGLWTPTVFALFALSLPIAFLAFVLGSLASHHIPADQFARAVRFGLLILGIILVLKA